MVESNSEKIGSEKLRYKMPYGAVLKMAAAFQCTDVWVANVIKGKSKGNPKIIECALELIQLQDDVNIKIENIISKYGHSN